MLDAMGFSADQIAGALSSLPESEAANVESILYVFINKSNLIDSIELTLRLVLIFGSLIFIFKR